MVLSSQLGVGNSWKLVGKKCHTKVHPELIYSAGKCFAYLEQCSRGIMRLTQPKDQLFWRQQNLAVGTWVLWVRQLYLARTWPNPSFVYPLWLHRNYTCLHQGWICPIWFWILWLLAIQEPNPAKQCAKILQTAELGSKRLLSCLRPIVFFLAYLLEDASIIRKRGAFSWPFSLCGCVFSFFSNGKMCLCLLPVHFFFSKIQNKKETLLFPSFKRKTKPNQTDKVQHNKNQSL